VQTPLSRVDLKIFPFISFFVKGFQNQIIMILLF
jgi:hypothetical protein